MLTGGGDHIKRLFACGEILGGVFYAGHPSSSGLTSVLYLVAALAKAPQDPRRVFCGPWVSGAAAKNHRRPSLRTLHQNILRKHKLRSFAHK